MENEDYYAMSSRNHRKVYDGAFKARVVLEVHRGEKTLAEIASEYEIHPNQIVQWKKHVINALPDILSRKGKNDQKQEEEMQDELYKQIGELKVQNEFLKKTWRSFPLCLIKKKNNTNQFFFFIDPIAMPIDCLIPIHLLLPSSTRGSFESYAHKTD